MGQELTSSLIAIPPGHTLMFREVPGNRLVEGQELVRGSKSGNTTFIDRVDTIEPFRAHDPRSLPCLRQADGRQGTETHFAKLIVQPIPKHPRPIETFAVFRCRDLKVKTTSITMTT